MDILNFIYLPPLLATMTTDHDGVVLRTTATSLDILELLRENDGARVSELAEIMDRPKSTIYGHLETLQAKEFVMKEGDVYYPGPELLRLGHYVHTSNEGYLLAKEFTNRIFEEVGLRTIFVAEMSGRGVFLHTAAGDRSKWSHEELGERLYLHDTAVGKAILAHEPRWKVERTLDKWGLPNETSNTNTDREELMSELEEVREQGYALNRGENIRGLHAVGLAAKGAHGNVIGAFSVSGPRKIFTDKESLEEIVDQLTALVEEYELELSLI